MAIDTENIRAPFDGNLPSTAPAVANNFGVLHFTGGVSGAETTHKANVLPAGWAGKWINAYCLGGKCWIAFSKNSSAEVDRTVAATEAGAALKVGAPLSPGEANVRPFRLPYIKETESLYFVRESDTVGTVVWLELASD